MGISDRNLCVIVKSRQVYRGDIYYADLCEIEGTIGSEQTGRRIKMQLEKCNRLRIKREKQILCRNCCCGRLDREGKGLEGLDLRIDKENEFNEVKG